MFIVVCGLLICV